MAIVSPGRIPRHWIWGGGGAGYYGVGNNDGRQNAAALADPGFEAGAVPPGTESAAPAGSGWICRGAAAIYRNWQVSTVGFMPGTYGKLAKTNAAGCSLTVAKPTQVRALGCWLRGWMSYNVDGPTLLLIGPRGPLAQAKVQTPRFDSWAWGDVAGEPVRLEPGATYHLLVQAAQGEPYVFSKPAPVMPAPVLPSPQRYVLTSGKEGTPRLGRSRRRPRAPCPSGR